MLGNILYRPPSANRTSCQHLVEKPPGMACFVTYLCPFCMFQGFKHLRETLSKIFKPRIIAMMVTCCCHSCLLQVCLQCLTCATSASIMGWFSGSTDKQPEIPSRQDRQKCWETRDAYFSCLDRTGVVKAGEEGTACSSELKKYEKNCAKSWVCVAVHSGVKVTQR